MNTIYNFLAYALFYLSLFYTTTFIAALYLNKKKLYKKRKKLTTKPFVTIIVPAYNEDKDIHMGIEALKKVKYPNVEFLVINDGSTDNTSAQVKKYIEGDDRFRFIDRKQNRGKANTLNQGIKLAKGELVACMDADSMVESRILKKTVPYFLEDSNMGAVTVSVVAHNPKGWLEKLIDIEYHIGLSLFIKLKSFFNAVFVTPGPFSLYRKKFLENIGGFDPLNITEDLEIAYRLQKNGYNIQTALNAEVRTVLPKGFKNIYIQRRRWYTGGLQTLVQHKDMLFNNKYGVFAYLVPFNFILIFGGLLLFFSSMWLSITNITDLISYFQHTNLDIWNRILRYNFDILNTGTINLVGYSALLFGVLMAIIGVSALRNVEIRKKVKGIMLFPLMFLLYQIYWSGSIYNFLRGKKVKWR